jgi:hypothetical protein
VFAVFFGRPADEIVGSEALWQISETAWVVCRRAPRAGRSSTWDTRRVLVGLSASSDNIQPVGGTTLVPG